MTELKTDYTNEACRVCTRDMTNYVYIHDYYIIQVYTNYVIPLYTLIIEYMARDGSRMVTKFQLESILIDFDFI